MSDQNNDRRPANGDESGNQPSTTKRRFSPGGAVGGGVMFAILYVVDKLRPSRRRKGNDDETKQVPASETPAAGTLEAITGVRPAPPGVHMSVSSPWPMVLAGAIAFTAFGIVTNYAFSLFGVIVMVVAIVGWVGEMLSE